MERDKQLDQEVGRKIICHPHIWQLLTEILGLYFCDTVQPELSTRLAANLTQTEGGCCFISGTAYPGSRCPGDFVGQEQLTSYNVKNTLSIDINFSALILQCIVLD